MEILRDWFGFRFELKGGHPAANGAKRFLCETAWTGRSRCPNADKSAFGLLNEQNIEVPERLVQGLRYFFSLYHFEKIFQPLLQPNIPHILVSMGSESGGNLTQFRVLKGEVLFTDGEDSVSIHYLQRQNGEEWVNVFQLSLEGGRSWGDEIDMLYHHNDRSSELLVHVSGFGYWGDTEFYRSLDSGSTWQPTTLRRLIDPTIYTKEKLVHVEEETTLPLSGGNT